MSKKHFNANRKKIVIILLQTTFLNGYVQSEAYFNELRNGRKYSLKNKKKTKGVVWVKSSPRARYECLHKYLDILNFV